jgi:hypothetical protein
MASSPNTPPVPARSLGCTVNAMSVATHSFLAVMPGVRGPGFTIATIWAVAATVVAVRQALDYTSTLRALAVSGLGVVLAVAVAVVLGLMFGPTVSG